MKTTFIYTCLIVFLIATLGCGKSTIYLNISDINGNSIPDEVNGISIPDPDVKVTINGREVEFDPTSTAEEKVFKAKKGKQPIVEVSQYGFRQETKTQKIEDKIEHIDIRLEPLTPNLKLETKLSQTKVVAGAEKICDVNITLTNEGKGDAFYVEVRGDIPEGLQSLQSTGSPQKADDSLAWSLKQLGAGDKYKVSYSLMPMSDAQTDLRVVKIKASASDIIGGKNEIEKSHELQVTGQAIIKDEDFQYEVSPTELRLNEEDKIEYTIRVRNSGGGKTIEITLSLIFPEGFTLDKMSLMLDGMRLPSQVRIIGEDSGPYSLELPPLLPGNNQELTYTVTVSKDANKGAKTSSATLTTKDEADRKIERSADATVIITQTPQPAELTVTKSMGDGPNNTLKCELSIKNDGNGSAREVEITDKLPNGFSLSQPIYLKENNPSEYEVISGEGGKTQYEAGLLKLSLGEHQSALVWLIDKLRAKSEIKIQYDIQAENSENIKELRDLTEKNGVIVTPYKVVVTALDEWDRSIPASANATYSPKTGADQGDSQDPLGRRGGATIRR